MHHPGGLDFWKPNAASARSGCFQSSGSHSSEGCFRAHPTISVVNIATQIKSLRKLGSLTPEERKSLKSLTKGSSTHHTAHHLRDTLCVGISLFDEKELAAVETFVDALPKVEMSISVDVDGSSEVRQDDVATLRVKLVRLGDAQGASGSSLSS